MLRFRSNLHDVREVVSTSKSVPGVSRSISVEAAARLTGVSPSTVRRALVRGDLAGYRTGQRGQFRIPPDALREWIRPAHTPRRADEIPRRHDE
jgi:excisionase family DNA binding protein